MENTPCEKVMNVEKKVYITPELVEYGILSEVTKTGESWGPDDAQFPGTFSGTGG